MVQWVNYESFPLVQASTESILEQSAAFMTNGSVEASGAGLIDAVGAIGRVENIGTEMIYLPVVLK